jgi:hypothetical protein
MGAIKDTRIDRMVLGYALTPHGGRSLSHRILHVDGMDALFSYGSLVAVRDSTGRTALAPEWNTSVTTRTYVARFLGLSLRDVRQNILEGRIHVEAP